MMVVALEPTAKAGFSASNTPPSINKRRQPSPDSNTRVTPPPIAVKAPSFSRMDGNAVVSPSTSQTVGSYRIRRSASPPPEAPIFGKAKPAAAAKRVATASGLLQISNAQRGAWGRVETDTSVTIAFPRTVIEMGRNNAHARPLSSGWRCGDQFLPMTQKAVCQLPQSE